MKTIIAITILFAAVGSAGEKVSICHLPTGEGQGRVMLIPVEALGGHLGHGDFLSLTCE